LYLGKKVQKQNQTKWTNKNVGAPPGGEKVGKPLGEKKQGFVQPNEKKREKDRRVLTKTNRVSERSLVDIMVPH